MILFNKYQEILNKQCLQKANSFFFRLKTICRFKESDVTSNSDDNSLFRCPRYMSECMR